MSVEQGKNIELTPRIVSNTPFYFESSTGYAKNFSNYQIRDPFIDILPQVIYYSLQICSHQQAQEVSLSAAMAESECRPASTSTAANPRYRQSSPSSFDPRVVAPVSQLFNISSCDSPRQKSPRAFKVSRSMGGIVLLFSLAESGTLLPLAA